MISVSSRLDLRTQSLMILSIISDNCRPRHGERGITRAKSASVEERTDSKRYGVGEDLSPDGHMSASGVISQSGLRCTVTATLGWRRVNVTDRGRERTGKGSVG